jgi:hypothetical protein
LISDFRTFCLRSVADAQDADYTDGELEWVQRSSEGDNDDDGDETSSRGGEGKHLVESQSASAASGMGCRPSYDLVQCRSWKCGRLRQLFVSCSFGLIRSVNSLRLGLCDTQRRCQGRLAGTMPVFGIEM